jgi:hypothetical protein
VSAPVPIGAKPAAPPTTHEAVADAAQVAPTTTSTSLSEPAASQETPRPGLTLPGLSPEIMAAAAATTLALAGLAIFGFRRWRSEPPPAPPADRDIGGISLGGGHRALAFDPRETAPDTPDAASCDGNAAPAAIDLPVPTTYTEALAILGASPDASTVAIKKIVDGLRQSWHPDHARSESDRLHREARVRQVNVAWDLVSQRRSAA